MQGLNFEEHLQTCRQYGKLANYNQDESPYGVNIPWVGSLEEPATSSYSAEYLPDALKWMDFAHCVQSPAYTAETVTLRKCLKGGNHNGVAV